MQRSRTADRPVKVWPRRHQGDRQKLCRGRGRNSGRSDCRARDKWNARVGRPDGFCSRWSRCATDGGRGFAEGLPVGVEYRQRGDAAAGVICDEQAICPWRPRRDRSRPGAAGILLVKRRVSLPGCGIHAHRRSPRRSFLSPISFTSLTAYRKCPPGATATGKVGFLNFSGEFRRGPTIPVVEIEPGKRRKCLCFSRRCKCRNKPAIRWRNRPMATVMTNLRREMEGISCLQKTKKPSRVKAAKLRQANQFVQIGAIRVKIFVMTTANKIHDSAHPADSVFVVEIIYYVPAPATKPVASPECYRGSPSRRFSTAWTATSRDIINQISELGEKFLIKIRLCGQKLLLVSAIVLLSFDNAPRLGQIPALAHRHDHRARFF